MPTTKLTIPAFWQAGSIEDVQHGRETIARKLCGCFNELCGIGSDGRGGYTRLAWTREDARLRLWFATMALDRGMTVTVDAAGNQWAWRGVPTPDNPGVAAGSHLDSVVHGGAFDGPLGVISAFLAVDELAARHGADGVPVGVANFSNEEGSRFHAACFGSRVLTGVIKPDDALAREEDGSTLAETFASFDAILREEMADQLPSRKAALFAGAHAPRTETYGTDEALLRSIASVLELHVDLGVHVDRAHVPVAVQAGIWPHGRWHVAIDGQSNHAGTTPFDFRRDALVAFSKVCLKVEETARELGMLATIGRVAVKPNGINVIASHVDTYIDARAETDEVLNEFVKRMGTYVRHASTQGPCRVKLNRMTRTPDSHFDAHVCGTICEAASDELDVPVRPFSMGAGHDAGILSDWGVPAGMIIVRNDTGVAHSRFEHATLADCADGVLALAASLDALAAEVFERREPA